MRAFIDTSSLVKKYILESGAEQFEAFLENISEIIVAPIYLVELHSAVERRLMEKSIDKRNASWIRQEAKRDAQYFSIVIWNDRLAQTAITFIEQYHLKTLDSVQLASGVLAQPECFVTSDKDLYSVAKKELDSVEFIG